MNPVWGWKHSSRSPSPGRCQLFPRLLFLCCCVNKRLSANCIFLRAEPQGECTQTQQSGVSRPTSTQNSTAVVCTPLCTATRRSEWRRPTSLKANKSTQLHLYRGRQQSIRSTENCTASLRDGNNWKLQNWGRDKRVYKLKFKRRGKVCTMG